MRPATSGGAAPLSPIPRKTSSDTTTFRPNPAFGQHERLAGFAFALQVIKDLQDHHRVLDAGNHLHRTAAVTADLDVDIEKAL